MRILISDAVLTDSQQWHDLEVLLDLARRKRCYVDVLNAAMATTNPWLNQASPRRREDWRNATDWAVLDASSYRLRTFIADNSAVATSGPPHITLAEAIELTERTASLWVENSRNDRRFLLSMMPADKRDILKEWEKNKNFEFRNGGGLGEARKAMEELSAADQLDPRMNWALFDSDAESPGHRSNAAQLMINFCNHKMIDHYCLERRAIENYLPQKALWNWANNGNCDRDTRQERRKKISAFKKMSDAQRYHFHLKSGWPQTPNTTVQNLYANISQADREALANGIDQNIALLYATYADYIQGWVEDEGFDAGLQTMIDELMNWIRVPYAR